MEPCIIFKNSFQFHLRRQPPPTTPTLNCRPSSITYKTRKISKFFSTLDDCSFPTNPINWNLWGMDGCHSHWLIFYLPKKSSIPKKLRKFLYSYQLGLPIPEGCGGAELKPGSLPNLTNLEIGHSNHPHHQDANQSNCGGGPQQNNEESPISSVRMCTYCFWPWFFFFALEKDSTTVVQHFLR